MQDLTSTHVAIIGAGPVGLEVAIALKRAGIDTLQFDGGQIGETIYRFPPALRFFSSSERIAIGGFPLQTTDQTKCTREQYLAYLRSIVGHYDLDVRTFERVAHIGRSADRLTLQTHTRTGIHHYEASRIVLATGGTARPRTLGVPGEDLTHVSHDLGDGHQYFGRRILVVGGRNSAVEAALRCYHAGGHVTISYRGDAFPDRVKYWLKPEIEALIQDGELEAMFGSRVVEITATHATIERVENGEAVFIPADCVLLMIGFEADMSLFTMIGCTLEGEQGQPVFDPRTMETDVPGVYVAGTATAGTQTRFRVYLENCHDHAERIVAAITGRPPSITSPTYSLPES